LCWPVYILNDYNLKPYILVIKEIPNMPPKKVQVVGSGTAKVVSEIILVDLVFSKHCGPCRQKIMNLVLV
jgi:hypothetical protein